MVLSHAQHDNEPSPNSGTVDSVCTQAEQLLSTNPYLAIRRITCEFRDGVLILTGCLPSYYLKQLAQSVVQQASRVERIENQIQVVPLRWHNQM